MEKNALFLGDLIAFQVHNSFHVPGITSKVNIWFRIIFEFFDLFPFLELFQGSFIDF